LVVEDNPVNQKVAKRLLERLGCTVKLANNGQEGVQACEQHSFDIVFMDLQMPVMDGLTATRHIRAHQVDDRRLPIIALTANAMVGQHERCLAAGMDGFLTKPIDAARLREVLMQFVGARKHVADAQVTEATLVDSPSAQLVDLRKFDELTAQDAAFANELVDVFVTSAAGIQAEMQQALALDDRKQLERAAHKLKGAAANIYASMLRLHAEELELFALAMDPLELDIHLTQMGLYIEQTAAYLRNARGGEATSALRTA